MNTSRLNTISFPKKKEKLKFILKVKARKYSFSDSPVYDCKGEER